MRRYIAAHKGSGGAVWSQGAWGKLHLGGVGDGGWGADRWAGSVTSSSCASGYHPRVEAFRREGCEGKNRGGGGGGGVAERWAALELGMGAEEIEVCSHGAMSTTSDSGL
jgi:hypothetical protein